MRRIVENTINTESGPVRIRYLSEDGIDDIFYLLTQQYIDTLLNGRKHDTYIPREIRSRYIKVFE